jgi:threonine dehydratase
MLRLQSTFLPDMEPVLGRLLARKSPLPLRMKIIIEPSSAVPLGSIFEGNPDVRGMRMEIILSGGNVD